LVPFEEVVYAFAGFLGEACGHVLAAGEAHGIFEDTLGAFENFGDGIRMIDFLKRLFAGEAGFEGLIVLERMEERRNVTHAQRWSELGTNPTFFGLEMG